MDSVLLHKLIESSLVFQSDIDYFFYNLKQEL